MPGTYLDVQYTDETKQAIRKIAEGLNLQNLYAAEKYHTTIAFSRVEFPTQDIMQAGLPPVVNEGPLQLVLFPNRNLRGRGRDGAKAACLKFTSYWLTLLHHECRILGASYDFEEYIPHITLSYDCGLDDLDGLDINAVVDLKPKSLYTCSLKIK